MERNRKDDRQKHRNEQTHSWLETANKAAGIGLHEGAHAAKILGESLGKYGLESAGEVMEGAAAIHTVAEMAKHFIDAVGACHDANSKAAFIKGVEVGTFAIRNDSVDPKSPHVKDGKTYDPKDFVNLVREKSHQAIYGDPKMQVENTKDYDKQIDAGIRFACDYANKTMAQTGGDAKSIQSALKNTANSLNDQVMKERLHPSVPAE